MTPPHGDDKFTKKSHLPQWKPKKRKQFGWKSIAI